MRYYVSYALSVFVLSAFSSKLTGFLDAGSTDNFPFCLSSLHVVILHRGNYTLSPVPCSLRKIERHTIQLICSNTVRFKVRIKFGEKEQPHDAHALIRRVPSFFGTSSSSSRSGGGISVSGRKSVASRGIFRGQRGEGGEAREERAGREREAEISSANRGLLRVLLCK